MIKTRPLTTSQGRAETSAHNWQSMSAHSRANDPSLSSRSRSPDWDAQDAWIRRSPVGGLHYDDEEYDQEAERYSRACSPGDCPTRRGVMDTDRYRPDYSASTNCPEVSPPPPDSPSPPPPPPQIQNIPRLGSPFQFRPSPENTKYLLQIESPEYVRSSQPYHEVDYNASAYECYPSPTEPTIKQEALEPEYYQPGFSTGHTASDIVPGTEFYRLNQFKAFALRKSAQKSNPLLSRVSRKSLKTTSTEKTSISDHQNLDSLSANTSAPDFRQSLDGSHSVSSSFPLRSDEILQQLQENSRRPVSSLPSAPLSLSRPESLDSYRLSQSQVLSSSPLTEKQIKHIQKIIDAPRVASSKDHVVDIANSSSSSNSRKRPHVQSRLSFYSDLHDEEESPESSPSMKKQERKQELPDNESKISSASSITATIPVTLDSTEMKLARQQKLVDTVTHLQEKKKQQTIGKARLSQHRRYQDVQREEQIPATKFGTTGSLLDTQQGTSSRPTSLPLTALFTGSPSAVTNTAFAELQRVLERTTEIKSGTKDVPSPNTQLAAIQTNAFAASKQSAPPFHSQLAAIPSISTLSSPGTSAAASSTNAFATSSEAPPFNHQLTTISSSVQQHAIHAVNQAQLASQTQAFIQQDSTQGAASSDARAQAYSYQQYAGYHQLVRPGQTQIIGSTQQAPFTAGYQYAPAPGRTQSATNMQQVLFANHPPQPPPSPPSHYMLPPPAYPGLPPHHPLNHSSAASYGSFPGTYYTYPTLINVTIYPPTQQAYCYPHPPTYPPQAYAAYPPYGYPPNPYQYSAPPTAPTSYQPVELHPYHQNAPAGMQMQAAPVPGTAPGTRVKGLIQQLAKQLPPGQYQCNIR